MINYAAVLPDLLPLVADRNLAKHCGNTSRGYRSSIVADACIRENRPDHVIILPRTLRAEVMTQLKCIRGWGRRFVTAVPSWEVVWLG
jgi:hypothetical protein